MRVAQKGNLLAKVEIFRLVRFTIDDWIDKYYCLSRWKGYNDEILVGIPDDGDHRFRAIVIAVPG